MSETKSQDLAHASHWWAARERYDALIQVIGQARHAYYDSGLPQTDDTNYGRLFRELEDIERERPELIGADSPAGSVGGLACSDFATVRCLARMISTNGISSFKELTGWEGRVAEGLGIGEPEMTAKIGIDSLAISLLYIDGRLEHAVARGDDYTGEDVSANVMTIRMVPQTLNRGPLPHQVGIRGEVYTLLKDFEAFNETLGAQRKVRFANPHNVAVGSLR